MSMTLSKQSIPSTTSCAPGLRPRLVEPVGEGLEDDLVDERRLAGARDARHADELRERETRRRRPSGCARARRGRVNEPSSARATLRHGDRARAPERNSPVTDRGWRIDVVGGALGDDLAPVLAGARPHVDEPVGGAHHLLVVLDDDARCCRGRAGARGCRSAGRCRAGGARSTARRGCRGRRRAATRSASRAGCRCASPPESVRGRAVEVEVADADVVEEREPLADLLQDPPPRSAPPSASASSPSTNASAAVDRHDARTRAIDFVRRP